MEVTFERALTLSPLWMVNSISRLRRIIRTGSSKDWLAFWLWIPLFAGWRGHAVAVELPSPSSASGPAQAQTFWEPPALVESHRDNPTKSRKTHEVPDLPSAPITAPHEEEIGRNGHDPVNPRLAPSFTTTTFESIDSVST